MKSLKRAMVLGCLVALPGAVACGDDSPTGPPGLDRSEVAGTYGLTILSFDPQGSLAEVDLRDRLVVQDPSLQLTQDGVAQLAFRDPSTDLLVTVNGTYNTTATSVRINFGEETQHRRLLLPDAPEFTFQAGAEASLTFQSTEPTVSRERLVELVPEFEDEQLLDPVPGVLEVAFSM